MKVAIRLQNHGCANHPLWWIVVAPNRRNIKGRFLEHVGYWSPRQGVRLQRQIVLNIPRIKYWISCGAVPTGRIQQFLAIWGILPKPWYYQRSQQQLLALKKPEQEMTDKEKAKQERKRKKKQRENLSYINYMKPLAKYKSYQYFQFHRYKVKLRQKIHAAQKENQILRQLLLHNQFYKVNRVNELAGNVSYDDTAQLLKLEEQLSKAKSKLALVDKNYKNASVMHKIKIMQEINQLVDAIREVQRSREPFRKRKNKEEESSDQTVTKMKLDKQLEYELIIKKLEAMDADFKNYESMLQTITLEQFAQHLVNLDPKLNPEVALTLAQETFVERGRAGLPPMTKFDLQFEDDHFNALDTAFQNQMKEVHIDTTIMKNPYDDSQDLAKMYSELRKEQVQEMKEHNAVLDKVHQSNLIQHLLVRPDVLVPTNRPVHPFPDLDTYIPQEYYEPITEIDLNMMSIGPLQPREQLDRYKQRRKNKKESNSNGGGKRSEQLL